LDADHTSREDRPPEYARGLLLALATWGLYFCVVWPAMLFELDDGLYAGWRTVWADWVAHFAYANVFAYWPVAEWFSSHPLSATTGFDYPFLANALSGLLMRMGLDRIWAFLLPSLLASLALVALLVSFYVLLLRRSFVALVATTLFFANGGLGFLAFAADLAAEPSLQSLLVPPREYTHLPGHHVQWINLVSSELLPQRSFLLGMPVALLVLIVICRYVASGFESASFPRLIGLGLLASLLAVTHLHSLLALAFVCALLLLFDRGHLLQWATFAAATALPALLVFTVLYGDVAGRGFLAWQPGWLANPMRGDGTPLLLFLWLNWGVFLPMVVASVLRFRGYRDPLILAGLGLFAACFLVRFQPNEWDNTKLLTWAHLLLCAPVARYLAYLWSRGSLAKLGAAALFVLATASGFLDLWRITSTEHVAHRMWSREEMELAEAFREISSPGATVLCSDDHHHWVPSLGGARVLLGYRGWLGSYGIDYGPIEQDVRAMLGGGPLAKELLAHHGVDFVVIGGSERRDYEAAERYFDEEYELVLEGAGHKVFSVGSGTSDGAP
jgi:hypothetical protein